MKPPAPNGASVRGIRKDRSGSLCFFTILGAAAFLFLFVGCKSAPPTPSVRLASVLVKAQPMEHIEEVTQEVFRDKGFSAIHPRPGEFVFEKAGTEMNTLVYGDWSDKKVWIRIKFFIRKVGTSDQILLECDAFMVNDHGDSHFEEEHKLTRVHRGRYQEILDQIGQRLA